MKDIKDYKGKKYAIQCKTQEEWDKITELLGYKWNKNNWGLCKEESCINASGEGATQKSSYINAGYEIIQASDFLQSTSKTGRWYKAYDNPCHYMKSTKISDKYLDGNEYIDGNRKLEKGSFSWDLREATLLTDLSEIQQFLPSGHPDKLPTFKFNIGDIVKSNGKGKESYLKDYCNDFLSSYTYGNRNCKIIERHTFENNGKNIYKVKFMDSDTIHGNWITEDGLELVKNEQTTTIPEYVECIKAISKQKVGDIECTNDVPKWTSGWSKGGFWNTYYKHYYKPSTKEAYENQQLMNKHNLVVGKYYTFNYMNKNWWFRLEKVEGDKIYSSGKRNVSTYTEWIEQTGNVLCTFSQNLTFKEVTEQEAKGKEEKWIPKVGDWVVWSNSSTISTYKVINLDYNSFSVELDGQEFKYLKPIKELCRKVLTHEIPNNKPDSNIQYWECTSCVADFTVGKIYKLNEGKTIHDTYAFTDNSGKKNGHHPYNQKYFKPSTEAAYNAQNQIVKQNVAITSTGTYFETWTNNGYTTINYSFKGNTPNINTPTTITIKNRTKKEEKPLTKTRTKLTILKPKSITI